MSTRALKAHREAALAVLSAIGPNESLEELAARVASAVVEAEDKTTWIVIVDAGPRNVPIVYGPYSSANVARRSIESGLMLNGPRGRMLVAMRPVPRKGATTNRKVEK